MSPWRSSYPLLGNRFAPITQAIGFLEAPFPVVIDVDRDWRAGIGSYPSRPLVGSLNDHLSALLPLTGPLSRYLWVTTNADWTAYFDNFRQGSDPWGPITYLFRRLGCKGVAILCASESRTGYGGAVLIFTANLPSMRETTPVPSRPSMTAVAGHGTLPGQYSRSRQPKRIQGPFGTT
jgi:hypothetical protein